MKPIVQWLEELGLGQYGEAFLQAAIDPSLLPDLSEADLEKLGVVLGHRKKLLRAIATLSEAARKPVPEAPMTVREAERRQLTVMFCDLVGSTALSVRLDPEELRDLVGAYHRCVAETVRRFDGFVAKYMGDGVLIYFGYPAAHEDDAERAVRAGISVINAVTGLTAPDPLQVRIGIATGLAVVGDLVGEGASQEQAIVGETPNLAARLQAVAEPGTIVLPAATRRLLGERFTLHSLGRQELKGFPQPVEAWTVEAVSTAESRFEAGRRAALTEFVGRQHELGLLMERWALARGGEGQVVLLAGEPGIGKSRILSELRTRLEDGGARSLRFHCSPYYVNSALYPIIDNFERALQFGRDDTPDQKLDRLERLLIGDYGRPRSDARFIASVLSIPCEDRYGTLAMTPQKFKDETLRVLVDTVEAIARRVPSVMLVEDAHWADPTTLELMDLLVHRARGFPLLAVVTHRPEFSPRWSQHGHVTALSLSKLTRGQSLELVSQAAAGKALPPDLLEQILAKTDGVPLFVEELTKSILESSGLRDVGDHWEYATPSHVFSIPMTLRDSLMARLDRFTPVKEIAQIGAAIGREFSYELIAAVASHSQPELDRALEQLVESGLAFQQGTQPDAVYTFKHALVRDAAYDSLLKRNRQQLHAKIARTIEERFPNAEATEPELLAHHYTEAKQPEKAIPLWQKAGSLALQRMALPEAIAHLDRGMELIRTLPASAQRDSVELDLRCLLGTSWMALKGWPAQEVWDSLHPALNLANVLRRNDALLPILWGVFVNVVTQGRMAESLQWVKRTLEAADEYHDPDLLIVGHEIAVISYFWLGELLKARDHADQVLSLYNEERHGRLMAILNHDLKTVSMMYTALLTWMLGYPEQAVRISDAKDAHARRRGHPFDLGFALTTGACVFDYRCEPDEWLKRLNEAHTLGRDNSLPVLSELLVPLWSGIASIRKGQIAAGMGTLRAVQSIWEGAGLRVVLPYSKAILAEAVAQVADLDDALSLLGESIAQVQRSGWNERCCYAEILRIKGWTLACKGDFEDAERCYIASLDWSRQQQAKSWELRAATSHARLMRDQGRPKEARDLLAPVYNWFTEGFDTKDLKEAKALLDELGERMRPEAAGIAAT